MKITHQDYIISFTAETTIYENEVQCHISENDFNYTLNPTATSRQREAAEAIGIIYVTTLLGVNNKVTVYAEDPDYGIVPLGSYVQQVGDTSKNALAISIASALSSNNYGYRLVVNDNQVLVTARPGLFSRMNGKRLIIEMEQVGIFDDTFDSTFN